MIAVQSTTATLQAHDDLAALLARNLTLGPVPASLPDAGQARVPPVAAAAEPSKIVYSISQHYHHSAHAVKPADGAGQQQQQQQQQQQGQDHRTPSSEAAAETAPEQLLAQNGIDAAALTPVQLALFRMSAPDRRDYLLQLWRICPPTRTAADYNPVAAGVAWGTMEAELEKEIASSQQRVQQSQQRQQRQQMADVQGVMSLDGTFVEAVHPATSSAAQSTDGRWLQGGAQSYMEPYMATGYDELARREYLASAVPPGFMSDASVPRSKDVVPGVQLRYRATDPVYDNRLAPLGRASWPQAHPAVDMENQYGALMAMRDGCEMEM